MGCINSKKKLTELRNDNVFRVRVVQLPGNRSGYLELNPRELIFSAQGGHGPQQQQQQSVVWALQHLRRYGLNGDVFSFEAGRRCMTGPGIYTFRCQQAERLYQLFQRYVNVMSLSLSEDVFSRERDVHPSHTLGHVELSSTTAHTNNYLEPAPLAGAVSMGGVTMRSMLHDSFSSSPLSLELDSPDSVPSVSFTNEVVHFQSHGTTTRGTAYVNTAGHSGGSSNSNVYLEYPLRSHLERNNNNNTNTNNLAASVITTGGNIGIGIGSGGTCGAGSGSGSNSAFSTLTRKTVFKRSSLDVPPEERAPMLTTPPASAVVTDALHMYANVESLGNVNANSSCLRERHLDPSERCYENLTRLDLPYLVQNTAYVTPTATTTAVGKLERSSSREQTLQQPSTPNAVVPPPSVNYIVLDLDQPRSPAPQSSPKTCFGSGLSLATEPSTSTTNNSNAITPITVCSGNVFNTAKPKETQQLQQQQQKMSESSLGYSTIDFIKTCALIKSSTHGADLEPGDNEELRITRHSKCVRKAYSISE